MIKRAGSTLLGLLLGLAAHQAAAQQLKCDIGPVNKRYGMSDWLVYSCDDARSVVIVTAPGNPASPFYFMLHPGPTGYGIEGEGTGSKAASDAAGIEIQKLTEPAIKALIEQTRSASKR